MQRPYYGNGTYDPGTDAVLTWCGWGGDVPSWGRGRGGERPGVCPDS